MGKFGIGQSVRRQEDARLLTGGGQYTDDIDLPGQVHAYFLRSPHAHAEFVMIDTGAAAAAPGVLAVYVGADVEAAGLGGLPCLAPIDNRDGSPMMLPPRPLLARGRVRHVGEPVAVVVAASLAAAKDAAELIVVDYEPLAAIVDTAGAAAPGAPTIWPEAPSNVAFRWHIGDEAKTADAFDRAAHITVLDLVNNRLVSNALEPRNAIATVEGGRYTLTCSNQGGHNIKSTLSHHVLNVPEDNIRVITPDVGGGFGPRYALYHEPAIVLWAAKQLGQPVKWVAERGEAFVSDSQGRDHVTRAELALDSDGGFLAIRARTTANLGAYLTSHGPSSSTIYSAPLMTGTYDIPAVSVSVDGVYTNTVPIDAYRGVGRAEANYAVERLVDTAARELGVEPDALRRRNHVPQSATPYTAATGLTFESADFARNMADAMQHAGWEGLAQRRADARDRGRLRGIGLSSYVESSGSGDAEEAAIVFERDGGIAVHVGTQSSGQGHDTVFAQIVEERLGVAFEGIRLVQGDTDVIPFGVGTFASRSLALCGSAIALAADKVVAKATKIAAQRLEAASVDVTFADGVFTVSGTDRSVTLAEVAVAAREPATAAAAGVEPGLDERARYQADGSTFASGCHVCEVEIDAETGAVDVVGFTVVDDFGRVVNPLIVEGQVHGGVTQGIGQALFEHTVYDGASGQLLSGSFMDYCIPRADDLPAFAFARNETPCTSNVLGIKGCGEAGAIGAPPALINAIVDALAELGVRDIGMPATPERVWRAIRLAKSVMEGQA